VERETAAANQPQNAAEPPLTPGQLQRGFWDQTEAAKSSHEGQQQGFIFRIVGDVEKGATVDKL
jgi:hypothetical protein